MSDWYSEPEEDRELIELGVKAVNTACISFIILAVVSLAAFLTPN